MRTIDEITRQSVRALTDYLHDDEQRHYEESDREAGHIFTDVERVQKWLAEPQGSNPYAKITPFESSRSNKPVANQWVITTDAGQFFQSYRSIIAFIPNDGRKTVLDSYYWNYSTTTGKYRNEFLGEDKATTQRKIESGEYTLADLNV